MKANYRIEGGPRTQGSSIVDLWTGEKLKGVTSIKLSAVPGDVWRADVTLQGVEVDVQAKAGVSYSPARMLAEIREDVQRSQQPPSLFAGLTHERVPMHPSEAENVFSWLLDRAEAAARVFGVDSIAAEIRAARTRGFRHTFDKCTYEWRDLAANAG